MNREDVQKVLKALQDIELEINEPEINELVTGRAEEQIEEAIEILEQYLGTKE